MKPLRLYIDSSVYNRPFDDLSQPRIWLEALAFAMILQMIEAGEAQLLSSDVLEFENSRNPFPQRRTWVAFYLSLADHHQKLDAAIRKRARNLERQGIKPLDALHLACAEEAKADYFITCDDQIVKRYQEKHVTVINPVDFILSRG